MVGLVVLAAAFSISSPAFSSVATSRRSSPAMGQTPVTRAVLGDAPAGIVRVDHGRSCVPMPGGFTTGSPPIFRLRRRGGRRFAVGSLGVSANSGFDVPVTAVRVRRARTTITKLSALDVRRSASPRREARGCRKPWRDT
jgi:hypothetical protein